MISLIQPTRLGGTRDRLVDIVGFEIFKFSESRLGSGFMIPNLFNGFLKDLNWEEAF